MSLQTPQNFIFDRGWIELLVLSGPDSNDFLNRLSTVNFKKPISNSAHGAFLNGQAKLISLFTAWQTGEKTYFFIEKEMFQKTKEYLEQMHFAENLKIETEKYFCVETRGENLDFSTLMMVDAYDWGLPGKYFLDSKKFETKSVSEKEYDAIRASFKFPKPLQDLTDDHILIEGPLDQFVDRNKGCYPGQEVIEKIYTYGRVARKIKKIIFENADSNDLHLLEKSLPLELEVDGTKIGILSSVHYYEEAYGLVTLKRLFYEKNENILIPSGGKILKARIEQD